MLAFAFYPSARAVYLSFFTSQGKFTLDNYKELFYFNLYGTIENTVILTVGALMIQLLLALGISSILVREFKGKRLVSTISIIPMGVATVVAAITFAFIFQTSGGYANTFLHYLGLSGINWYFNSYISLFIVMIADSWKNTPIMTLIILAGMYSIPRDLYYAAALDGAGPLRRFVHITLPNLKKFIAIALIIRGVSEFNIFALPLILIGYSPSILTTLAYSLYSTTTENLASAAAVIILIFVSVLIALNIKLGGKR
ncbi:Trehalose/maltose transport system permease protein MalF [Sulfuracidifex tepidarius]|uniref:Trehalose/maltose transport system permease protein MalF n=1 Tax=Sulfuracidifex tepidarius TaxID=1294262 RepID=A0A510DS76_9CREN|nr:Trehalose/maltose transport system permease protein MalF [Sulfuracidifex tepidarius]BBG25791.1 Trehalose/maltose transport system permease protein MalF [Sulfuracidifex tepidarius]